MYLPTLLSQVPTTVFTPLELAAIGLTEDQANTAHGEDNIEVSGVLPNGGKE